MEKKIHYSEFGVDTGKMESSSSISFKPHNCPMLFADTLSRKTFDNTVTGVDLNTLKHGTVIYLACVAFEGCDGNYYETPYFVIINVALKMP
jgi:hypothetical protein